LTIHINHQLRESLGEAGAAVVVNEGAVDEVAAQVQALSLIHI